MAAHNSKRNQQAAHKIAQIHRYPVAEHPGHRDALFNQRNKEQAVPGEQFPARTKDKHQSDRKDKRAQNTAEGSRLHPAGCNAASCSSKCDERPCKNPQDKHLPAGKPGFSKAYININPCYL